MKTIIGYTDSINECDCCGKTELKGTYCIDLDGVELYYGSVCAYKNHGLTIEEQKKLKGIFTNQQKNAKLIELYITPLRKELAYKLSNRIGFNNDNYIKEYNRVIELRAKKYKISL